MAEPEKRTSPTSKGKGKTSLLDEDLPKEFFGSWNSALGSDDSSMDFNFESVSKGPKKAFDFDKLDLDFSLDGEFDKIKSFKMDMGDTDFSSPSKDSTKANVRSEAHSSKSTQRKEDPFSFSFDFNDLDNFDFDSVLPKGEKKLHNEEGSKKVDSSDNVGSEDSRVLVVDDRPKVQEPSIGNVVSLDAYLSKSDTSVVRQSIPDYPDKGHVSKSPSQVHQTEPNQSKSVLQKESTSHAQVLNLKGNNIKQIEVDSSDEKSSDGSSNMEAVSSKDVPPSIYDRETFTMNNNITMEQEGSDVMSVVEMDESKNANKQKSELGGSEDCVWAKNDLFVGDPSANINSVQRLGSFMAESNLPKEKRLGEFSSINLSRHKSILNKEKSSGPVQSSPARRKLPSFNPTIITSVGRDSVRANNKVDRIPSSKINMSAPSFSSTPKDSTKENVRPENQRKEEPFSFSSNFIDNLASDSALPKVEKKFHNEEVGKKIDSLDDSGSDDSGILVVDNQGVVQEPIKGNVVTLDARTSNSETTMAHQRVCDYPDNGDIFETPAQSHQLESKRSQLVPQRKAVNAQETDQKGENRQQMEVDSMNEKTSDGSSIMQALSSENVPLSESDCEMFTTMNKITLEQEVSRLQSAEGMPESEKTVMQKNELGSPNDSVMRAKIDSFVEDRSSNDTSLRSGPLMENSISPKGNAQGKLSSAHCSSQKSIMKKDKAFESVQASTSRRKLVSFHQNTVFPLHRGRSGIGINNKGEGSTLAGNSTSYTHAVAEGGSVSNSIQSVHDDGTSGSGEGLNATNTQIRSDVSLMYESNKDRRPDKTTGSGEHVKKSEDSKPSSSKIHSQVLSKMGSQSGKKSDERPEPRILKPTRVLGVKFPSLKEGKMIPDFSNLKISSMSALEDCKSMRSSKSIALHNATMRSKPVDTVKPLPPNPFLKRKTNEAASVINPVTSHLAKRHSPSQNSFRQASENVIEKEIAYKLQKPHGSDEQPESTFELTLKNSNDKDSTSAIQTDERIMKVEACTKQIDEICNQLRRNEKQAQDLLVRAMVNNNRLLLLNQSIHDEKLHKVQALAAKLMSKDFQERA